MPKEVDVKLRCQLRRGLSLSILRQNPFLKFWVYYLTFLKLRLMTRSIIGLRFWETFYQLLKWKKLRGCPKYKLRQLLTEYQLIVDSTEQPIVRPIDYELQKDYYSERKIHTLKSIYCFTTRTRYCRCYCWWSGKSDINLFREHQNKFGESQSFRR